MSGLLARIAVGMTQLHAPLGENGDELSDADRATIATDGLASADEQIRCILREALRSGNIDRQTRAGAVMDAGEWHARRLRELLETL